MLRHIVCGVSVCIPFNLFFELLECAFVLFVLWIRFCDLWWRGSLFLCDVLATNIYSIYTVRTYPTKPIRKLWFASKIVYKLLLNRSCCSMSAILPAES